MDANNQIPQAAPPNAAPPVPQTTAPQAQMPDTPANGSNKIVLWFVIGLVIVVLVVGGIYLFLSRQQATQTVPSPAGQATPKPQDTVDALDKDLNSINVDTGTNSDFTSLDQDLQQL